MQKEISIEGYLNLNVEIEGTAIPYRRINSIGPNGPYGYPEEEGGFAEDIRVFLAKTNKKGEVTRLDITDFLSKDDLNECNEMIMEEFIAYQEGLEEHMALERSRSRHRGTDWEDRD